MVHPSVSVAINPGSRQVLMTIARDGALADLIASGFRILESSCGPCIGMGQAPASGTASMRTFNRNFQGRSGTLSDQVYLCSPQVAAATALTGRSRTRESWARRRRWSCRRSSGSTTG